MKRLFLCALFAAVFATMASYAQTISSADLPPIKPIEKNVFDTAYTKIYYEYSFRKDSLKTKRTEGQTILLVGKYCLGFMDYYRLMSDNINDSLYYAKQSPMTLFSKVMGIMKNIAYKYPLVIDKRTGQATIQVNNINKYEYTEPQPVINWKLADGDTVICDVPCKKASCTFGGREWTAWYAPAYHLQAGPYLFSGLPGLIFDIRDTKDNYHFTLNGLENLQSGVAIYLNAEKNIIRTTRKNVFRAVENEQRDILKAFKLSSPGIQFSEDMKKQSHSRPYNPIEFE